MVYESDFYTTRRPYRTSPSYSTYTTSVSQKFTNNNFFFEFDFIFLKILKLANILYFEKMYRLVIFFGKLLVEKMVLHTLKLFLITLQFQQFSSCHIQTAHKPCKLYFFSLFVAYNVLLLNFIFHFCLQQVVYIYDTRYRDYRSRTQKTGLITTNRKKYKYLKN